MALRGTDDVKGKCGMTYLVARTCTELIESSGQKLSRSVVDLRALGAYVLLGDPGSGKSETFKAEANTCDGFYVSARDFLALVLPTEIRNKTLFIDGLDESRAGEGDGRTPLDRIRRHLDELGRPSFRLSCREADWLGASDRHALTAVAPGGPVSVFHLDPLTDEQIREILLNDSSIYDADVFLKHAEDRGLAMLLRNPQTLKLLVEAVTENQWPSTRQETFQLACEKLATELNIEHRSAIRSQTPNSSTLLDAAGGLCALQLFADISGFTETGESKAGFIALRDIACLNELPIAHALKTRLFVGVDEERFAPAHRSVAEYLAARYLARVIESHGLPIGRVLSLMTAADGGTVAGLRGLHAWLAVYHSPSRQRLIEIDPLGVILYGDVRLFSVEEKDSLLEELHRLAHQYTSFRWQDWSPKPFSALATPDMTSRLKLRLAAPARDEGDQAFLSCVLDAVRYGDPLPELRDELRLAVIDATRWPRIRFVALKAYIHVSRGDPEELLRIAEDIRDNKIADPDDEMLGILLYELFPKMIKAQDLLTYLHRPKDDNLIGTYFIFWSRRVAEAATDENVAVLLDALATMNPSVLDDQAHFRVRDMAGTILARGVKIYGETIGDDRLYRWLGVAVDEHGFSRIENKESAAIEAWLEGHPERFKGLLSVMIAVCATNTDFRWCLHRGTSRFSSAQAPGDTGSWWLDRADSEQDQERAENYFVLAVGHLLRGQGAAGLSLEFLEKWVATRPRFASVYQRSMYEEIPDWRRKHVEYDHEHRKERQKRKEERVQFFRTQLHQIRTGRANPAVLYDLASAYLGRIIEARGDTELERLSAFLDQDQELVSATREGFRRSLERPDLPTVAEIIKLHTKNQSYYIRRACLVGLTELFRASADSVLTINDDVLCKAVAFYYTDFDNDPDWLKAVVQQRPALVASVLVPYVAATLKARKDHIVGVYPLANDDAYAGVAQLAVMSLLRLFPTRARKKQVSGVLGELLKAALRYINDDDIKQIINDKLALPKLDSMQRAYWLAAGMSVAPRDHITALSAFVGKSRAHKKSLSVIVGHIFNQRMGSKWLHETTAAYFVRLFAPICSPDRPQGGGRVTPAMRTAEFVHSMVNRLGGAPTATADEEIRKLLADSSLSKWHSTLRHAQHAQRISYREATFRHPTILEACQTLENRAPANAADLAALTSEYLRELALEIRHGNTDQFKAFWNVDKYARPVKPRPEDACRDTLLERLRDRLRKLGVDAQPEGHYADDKRADIRVSYVAPNLSTAIPIEIKRDSHPELWQAMSDQLVDLYTRDPESKGHGVYLAFWFGDERMPAPPKGDRPTTAAEFETQLLSMRPKDKRGLISVCVIDCSRRVDK